MSAVPSNNATGVQYTDISQQTTAAASRQSPVAEPSDADTEDDNEDGISGPQSEGTRYVSVSHPHGHSHTHTSSTGVGRAGVNVADAENEFRELSRQLSGLSRRSSQVSRTRSREKDVEKGGDEKEQFDLEGYLHGARNAEDEAGIKSKRIGEFLVEILSRSLKSIEALA
jgi:hypothetical protein